MGCYLSRVGIVTSNDFLEVIRELRMDGVNLCKRSLQTGIKKVAVRRS
jgi:hypothetical protein